MKLKHKQQVYMGRKKYPTTLGATRTSYFRKKQAMIKDPRCEK